MHKDQRLLEAYRNGETWAYEALYLTYAAPVRRFIDSGFSFVSRGRTCHYRGGSGGIDSDAIVQETFVRIFSASTRRNYDGERPFRNYVFSIAKNLVLREFQRKERVLNTNDHEEMTDALSQRNVLNFGLSSDEDNPEDTVADEELRQVTRAFIDELNAEETRFFTVRFARGLTQEATAAEMNVTRARVKLLEKNLRRRFLDCLRDHGYFVGYTPKPRWARESERAAA